MKNIINKLFVVLALPVMLFFTACQENYLKYDTSHSGVYFTKDTLKYSFSVTPLEITSYEFKVPFMIMGVPSKNVREVSFVVNPDSTTAVEGVHYTIAKAFIQPDSISGYIPVTILRDNLEGDYENGYVKYRLCMQLVENENFTPTLSPESHVRILEFDNAIDTPEWLRHPNAGGGKIWVPGNPHSHLGSWHPYTYMKLVEQFKTLKDVPNMEETYWKMVEYYGGENLEKVPYAQFHPYLPIMQKYVFAPLYEYFSNEANREEILALYPDYPFDFPNPYASSNE